MDYEEYVSQASPMITLLVDSKEELEEMFPAVDISYEKYMDEFKQLFTGRILLCMMKREI